MAEVIFRSLKLEMKIIIAVIAVLLSSCTKQNAGFVSGDYTPMLNAAESDIQFIKSNINGKFDDNLYYKLAKDYQQNQRNDFEKLQTAVGKIIAKNKVVDFDKLKMRALLRIEAEIGAIGVADRALLKKSSFLLGSRPSEDNLKPDGYELISAKVNKMSLIFNNTHSVFVKSTTESSELFREILSKKLTSKLFQPLETEIGLFIESDSRMNLSVTENAIFLLSTLYELDKNEYRMVVKSIPTIVFFYKTTETYFDKSSMLFFEKEFPLVHNGYSFGGSGVFFKSRGIGKNFAKEPHDCSEGISYALLKDAGVEEKMACGSYFSTYDFLNLYRIKKMKTNGVDYSLVIDRSDYYYLDRYFDIFDISQLGLDGLKKGDILLWRVGVKAPVSRALGDSGHVVAYLGNRGDRIYGLQHGRQIEDFRLSGYGIAVYSYEKLINSDKISTIVIRKKESLDSIKSVDRFYDKFRKCQ